jgi:drug/metabolite transporter (DMT)-like permease
MNALLLILVVLGITAQHVTKKIYNQKTDGGAYTFSAISAFVALIFFVITSGGDLHFTWDFVPHAIGFALTYSLSIVFSFLAITAGPLSITSLITSYSLLIPTVYGLIAWGEDFSILLAIGILLLIISIYLIRFEPKSENEEKNQRLTPKWLLYVSLAFIGGGGCSAVQKGQQLAFQGAYKNEFMIVALGITTIAVGLCALIYEKKQIVLFAKRSVLWASLCGAANGAVNYIVLLLSMRMAASIMFPIISAGGIVMAAMLSMTVYKEKLSGIQKIGLALGVLAIIVLNI